MSHLSYPIPREFASHALLTESGYNALYQYSIQDPAGFWGEQAHKFVSWFQPWDSVLQGDLKHLNVQWFVNGKLNACYNCVDRHLPTRGEQIALLWEGDAPHETKQLTYAELHAEVCRLANVLKKFGVKKGDRVCIYLPMIPEAAIAMLACARIGAIHSVIFGGFSAGAIADRVIDADCRMVITANEGMRGGKIIPLKQTMDMALIECPNVDTVLVVKRNANTVQWNEGLDHWYHEEMNKAAVNCPCEVMDAQDALFILYTSGSTGKPKGIVHTTGGYLVYTAITYHYIFNHEEQQVYWCTADVGWITGHSYSIYGPLCNGATILLYEGVPNYPTASRCWEIVDKYHVTIFYTSPTAIRALRAEGDEWVTKTQRRSLRLLGTVGEPINPDVWEWYYAIVGDSRCPIVDTWWQTESGGILISPFPGVGPLKPGAASRPFFGISPAIFNEEGKTVPANTMGKLMITTPWPGMLKAIQGQSEGLLKNYFSEFAGTYLTGDDARCDVDGYYWIAGRNDDVLKISGHRLGTGELENAFLKDSDVAEAAVVAVPDKIKGENIYAFITLKANSQPNEELKQHLIQLVRTTIGAIATPGYIQFADALPKTRSGKIMRRLLRKIANNDLTNLGDTATLADPSVVTKLIENRLIK